MAAVEVRGGYKFYGRATNQDKKIVLDSLDMTVMHGSIYGLLGASGCGKTTLLSCIVGRRKLNSGTITVLGGQPGTIGSGVPGPRVGYMPQDIALISDFSVAEMIFYFGRIYGMSKRLLHDRFDLLCKLLDLPDPKRRVSQMSGGQQRRVSFACALVHEPELLILDEPTVGLDPILRERIWNYLLDTTNTSKLAVIITTHYIEEAKMAHRVGLMRNGILLAEDSPTRIIQMFSVDSLEDAFLQFCLKHGASDEAGIMDPNGAESRKSSLALPTVIDAPDAINDLPSAEDLSLKTSRRRNMSFQELRPPGLIGAVTNFTSTNRMKALLSKNVLQFFRQPAAQIFSFVFPIMIISLFYLSVGGKPKDLKLGIVNEEVPNYLQCSNQSLITTIAHDDMCEFNKISCRFILEMEDDLANKLFFETPEEAFEAFRKRQIFGYIHLRPNFTAAITSTVLNGSSASNESFIEREISVRLDTVDKQITFILERRLRDTFKRFSEKLLTDCNYPKGLATVPVEFQSPVYGSFSDEYTIFAAPGVIMTVVFFLSTISTSTVFITERLEGIWDRVLVAGITTPELLIAHVLIQLILLTLQCTEIVCFVAFIFGIDNKGDNLTVIAMLVLIGITGLLFGLFISIVCDSYTSSNFVASGTFYPMILLCGILWPLEGMPIALKYLSFLLPFTIPSISMRNVLTKGYAITHSQVYDGFVVLVGWNIIFGVLCILGLKLRK